MKYVAVIQNPERIRDQPHHETEQSFTMQVTAVFITSDNKKGDAVELHVIIILTADVVQFH